MSEVDEWGAFVERAPASASGPGPLAGVRVAVKDNIAVAGLKWTCGLPLLSARRAEADASSVARLRAAGAEIVGVVATDSAGFGMTTPGVRNPRDPALTVGGSSGGSAAAVAAGLADVALGTDTAGSVRVPAACCGVMGFKPTFGKVATDGVTELARTFDHVGLLACDLDTIERAAAVLLGEAPAAPVERPLVIGNDPTRLSGCEDGIAEAVFAALIALAARGHTIREVRLPEREALIEAHGIVTCAEAREVWAPHWPQDARQLGDTVRRTLEYAQHIADGEVAEARGAIARLKGEIDAALEGVDVMLGPTMRVPPPKAGARKVRVGGEDLPVVHALLAETCPFNVSGHPALSLPMPGAGPGVPVSLQLAGKDDMALLAQGRAIMAGLRARSAASPAR